MTGAARRHETFLALYRAGLSFAAIARRCGASRAAVWGWAKRRGLAAPPRPDHRPGPGFGRLPGLHASGASFTEAARRLRVSRRTVQRWARLHGLPPPPDRYGPAWRENHRRAVHAFALRHEADSLEEYYRRRRQEHYRSLGYPPGVGCAWEARAVDLARRLNGLTAPDLVAAGFRRANAGRYSRCSWGWACYARPSRWRPWCGVGMCVLYGAWTGGRREGRATDGDQETVLHGVRRWDRLVPVGRTG